MSQKHTNECMVEQHEWKNKLGIIVCDLFFPWLHIKSWNSCERSGRKKNILWGKKCINWRFCKWNGNESLPEWKIPSRISNFFLPSRFIKWVNNNNLMFLFVSVEIKKSILCYYWICRWNEKKEERRRKLIKEGWEFYGTFSRVYWSLLHFCVYIL